MNLTALARDGWSFTQINRAGKLAGFFCVKGTEIHCYRLDDFAGRWITRQDLERLTKPIFNEYGEITTKVRTDNLQGHSFVKRLGFTATHDDGSNIHYQCKRLKHARH